MSETTINTDPEQYRDDLYSWLRGLWFHVRQMHRLTEVLDADTIRACMELFADDVGSEGSSLQQLEHLRQTFLSIREPARRAHLEDWPWRQYPPTTEEALYVVGNGSPSDVVQLSTSHGGSVFSGRSVVCKQLAGVEVMIDVGVSREQAIAQLTDILMHIQRNWKSVLASEFEYPGLDKGMQVGTAAEVNHE